MSAQIAHRKYGKHSVELSIIGMGGIVLIGSEQGHCNQLVGEFVEKGINYFDVAPSYGKGEAEAKLGPALEPHREDCFLACKTTERTSMGGQEEFKQSLKRLRTDRFDLYQLHALNDVSKDVDAAFAEDGIMNWLIKAKQAGDIGHIGFSTHNEEAALAALERYDFDSVLMPISFSSYFEGGFGRKLIAKAQEQGVGILALKGLAREEWPADDPDRQVYSKCWYKPVTDREEARLAMRFTLSEPIVAAVPPGDEALFRLAYEMAIDFEPITGEEMAELERLATSIRHPLFRTR